MTRKLPTDPASVLEHKARKAFAKKLQTTMGNLRSQTFVIAGLTYIGVEDDTYGDSGTYVLENTKLTLIEYRAR